MITATRGLLTAFGLLALLSIYFSCVEGSSLVNSAQFFAILSGKSNSLATQLFFEIRLPRTLAAFVTGGLLALAGALMQVLLRNPLADPYILGVSGGAGVGGLLGMMFGLTSYFITGGAWLGSLTAILIVFGLAASKENMRSSSQHLLLTGIAVASGFSAIISLMLIMSPNRELRSLFFWLLGDLSYAHPPWFEAGVLFIGLFFSFCLAKPLNILTRGELTSQSLGINTQRLQWQIYFLCAIMTATAVTLAGCIGFIGLIVPHLFRLIGGFDHRYLLPGCVLLGGSLVTIADMLARILLPNQQLPVGILLAFIGIPVFLFLLHKNSA